MTNTTADDVIQSFESSFADKKVIPKELEIMWLKKAVGRYCLEIESIEFDELTLMFLQPLQQYIIDTLALFMKQSYQERETSLVNKRVSIVSKDFSIDGNNGSKTAAANELNYIKEEAAVLVAKQQMPSYAN